MVIPKQNYIPFSWTFLTKMVDFEPLNMSHTLPFHTFFLSCMCIVPYLSAPPRKNLCLSFSHRWDGRRGDPCISSWISINGGQSMYFSWQILKIWTVAAPHGGMGQFTPKIFYCFPPKIISNMFKAQIWQFQHKIANFCTHQAHFAGADPRMVRIGTGTPLLTDKSCKFSLF